MHKVMIVLLFALSVAACSNSSSVSDANIRVYSDLICKRIMRNLPLTDDFKGLQIKVNLKLDEKSAVEQYSILKSSGLLSFDQAVEKAVYDSFPFEPLLNLNRLEYEKIRDINLTVMPE